MLLLQAERRLDLAERLVVVIADERDASRVTHRLTEILRARIFAIACGYEDADELDRLRCDAAFKLALRAVPRKRNRSVLAAHRLAPGERAVVARPRPPDEVTVDLYCASYPAPPAAVTLDIDDTVDVVHGH